MNITDIKTIDDKGLLVRRQDLIGEITSLRFQHATGQLENTAVLRGVRRELARVNTVIRERENEQGLHKGGLDAAIGKLDASESAFSAFRKHMGQE